MMSDADRAQIVNVIAAAKQVVAPDNYNNCWACDHDVEACDCGLAKLRAAVVSLNESEDTK